MRVRYRSAFNFCRQCPPELGWIAAMVIVVFSLERCDLACVLRYAAKSPP